MFNHEPIGYVCPICNLIVGVESKYNKSDDIIYNTDSVIAIISPKWWPRNPGHVMILPTKHYENIYDIPDEILDQVNRLSKKVAIAMKQSYRCDGTSTRQHNEPAGNQDLWHFHLHVFPRWEGDDLYLQQDNATFIDYKDRKSYAEKLRNIFNS